MLRSRLGLVPRQPLVLPVAELLLKILKIRDSSVFSIQIRDGQNHPWDQMVQNKFFHVARWHLEMLTSDGCRSFRFIPAALLFETVDPNH